MPFQHLLHCTILTLYYVCFTVIQYTVFPDRLVSKYCTTQLTCAFYAISPNYCSVEQLEIIYHAMYSI